MALKIHCIFNNQTVLPDLIKLVEQQAHKFNSKKQSARVEDVYYELRDQGYEIDAESVAFAYEQVSGILGRKGFSTQADVRKFGSQSFKSAIEVANRGTLANNKLGRASLNTAVASGIANAFASLEGKNNAYASRLVELQTALKKAANGLLDKKGYQSVNANADYKTVLQKYFDIEDIATTGAQAMQGKVKSGFKNISDVWDAVKKDVDAIAGKIKDPAARQRFMDMTEALRTSSYDLLLSTKESDEAIKGILKDAGYVKTINVKGNPVQVVDWNAALANQNDWRADFETTLRRGGFNQAETQRIMNRLETQYTNVMTKQAENRLNAIKKKTGVNAAPVNKDALKRLMRLRAAGIFSPKNASYLREALGIDVPQDIADQVAEIITDFERNTKETGAMSNVETEEVTRAVQQLLEPLGKTVADSTLQSLSDVISLTAMSTIATAFNSFQNVTSGVNSTVLSSLGAIAKTRNLKLVGHFMRSWLNAAIDVSKGGVTIRDARTINSLEQLQGRGGLSDRWTFDNAKGVWGYTKAFATILGQITATAMDAANGTAIYNAEMVTAVKAVLKTKGLTGSQANKAIDDMIFGKHPSGISNRKFWLNEATKRLDNQEGVVSRVTKAGRIADELAWHKLITDYGMTIEDVKAMMSASLEQKSRNLGHVSDVRFSPSTVLQAVGDHFNQKADEAHEKGNRGAYISYKLSDQAFKTMNMFMGGKSNWAILALQNSPIGLAFTGFDWAIQTLSHAGKNHSQPLFKQNLAIGTDSKLLRDQLAARKAMGGRLQRNIVGSLMQMGLTALVMQAMGGDDDDEEKDRSNRVNEIFADYMEDPNTRRMMDKMMPTILAAELAYAYDRKKKQFMPERISDSWFLPKYEQSVGAMYNYTMEQVKGKTGYDNLVERLGWDDKIKDEDKRAEAKAESVSGYIGGLLKVPYTSWYQIVKKEVKVFQNGFEPDPEEQKRQTKEYKEQLKNIDGKADAFIKGMATTQLVDFFKEKAGIPVEPQK